VRARGGGGEVFRVVADVVVVVASSKLKNKGLRNTMMQLRKICQHPYLFFPCDDVTDEVGLGVSLSLCLSDSLSLSDRAGVGQV
jgi:hypothetical protein